MTLVFFSNNYGMAPFKEKKEYPCMERILKGRVYLWSEVSRSRFFFTPIVIQTQIMPFYPAMIYKEIVLKKVTCAMKHGINSVFICTEQILIEPVAPLRMGL